MCLNPSTLGGRGRLSSEFEASLIFILSSRTAKGIQRIPVSKQNTMKQKEKKNKKWSHWLMRLYAQSSNDELSRTRRQVLGGSVSPREDFEISKAHASPRPRPSLSPENQHISSQSQTYLPPRSSPDGSGLTVVV